MKDPKIDPEIRDLLPPLSADEDAKLGAKLQLEGCLKPLIVWHEENILLDGHHSLKHYKAHKIPVKIERMKFPNRELAIEWVIDNQLGRRNLTDERRSYYIGKEYLNHKKSEGRPKLPQSEGVKAANGETAEKLADKHGVSRATVERNAAFAAGVDGLPKKAQEKILSGESGVPKAQVAESLFCDRCKRTGPSKDCPKCAAIQEKAGRKPKAKPAPKPPKSGSEIFDWKGFDVHLGHVLRGPNGIKAAYAGKNFPGEGQSEEFAQCEKLLKEFAEVWDKWRKRLQKVK